MIYAPKGSANIRSFFHSAQTGRKNIVSGRDLSLSSRKTGDGSGGTGDGSGGTGDGFGKAEGGLDTTGPAWPQRGRHGHNRGGMATTGTASTRGEAVLVNKGRCAQREGRYGQNGRCSADATGRHGYNGTTRTTRCGSDKTKCATDKIGNKFSFCRPPFTIFAGRQTPGRQVESGKILCGYAFENGLCCLCDKLEI